MGPLDIRWSLCTPMCPWVSDITISSDVALLCNIRDIQEWGKCIHLYVRGGGVSCTWECYTGYQSAKSSFISITDDINITYTTLSPTFSMESVPHPGLVASSHVNPTASHLQNQIHNQPHCQQTTRIHVDFFLQCQSYVFQRWSKFSA